MPLQDQGIQSLFKMTINGSVASAELMGDLLDCTVESSIHMPDVCTLRIHDHDEQSLKAFHWTDSEMFKPGTSVKIEAGHEDGNPLKVIFQGEVTAVEVDMESAGTTALTVRCMDKLHRLHRGRSIRTFVNVKDSDLVSRLAGNNGLTSDADETQGVYDWVIQYNQTDWEFLSDRAARNGYRLYLEGEDKLSFKKIKTPPETVTLTWGDDLHVFRPRLNAALQVNQVNVQGWDFQEKQAILGTASSPASDGLPAVGTSASGGGVAQTAFSSSAKMTVVDRPIFTQDQAQNLAQSILDDIGGCFIEAEGECLGNPDLLPGIRIDIKKIGTRFSGKYYVTTATHTYAAAVGYMTHFTVSGKRPDTVVSSLDWDGAGRRAPMGGNLVVGIVTDNKDPQNMGRVKVKYPWLSDTDASDWARLVTPMAGKGRGIEFLPEIDDEVFVAFEHGDVHRPFVLGAVWNGKDETPRTTTDATTGEVVRRIIKTRLGHFLLFKDTDDGGGICLQTQKGHTIEIHDDNDQILLKTVNGHTVQLDDAGKKILVQDMTGSNKMTIGSTDNSIAMECNGNFSIRALGQVSIQGQQGITMSTPMQLSASADTGMSLSSSTTMSVSANATMDLSATGPLSVSGAIVNINS